jgi:hypothetical protein
MVYDGMGKHGPGEYQRDGFGVGRDFIPAIAQYRAGLETRIKKELINAGLETRPTKFVEFVDWFDIAHRIK